MSLDKPRHEDPFSLSYRFTDYHEPLNRWPFISPASKSQAKSHGHFPPLLSDRNVTKGVPHLQRTRNSISDRVASNYSPGARNLNLSSLRRYKNVSSKKRKPLTDSTRKRQFMRRYSSVEEDNSLSSSLIRKKRVHLPSVSGVETSGKRPFSKPQKTVQLFPYKSCQRLTLLNRYTAWQKISIKTEPSVVFKEASLPNSPSKQLEILQKLDTEDSEDEEDVKRYFEYVLNDRKEDSQTLLPEQIQRIRSKLKSSWLTDLMMKKHILNLFEEVKNGYDFAYKVSVVNYVLLDPEERERVRIKHAPPRGVLMSQKRCVIRAPVPWHQNYIVAKQFCRHNLFTTSSIMQRINAVWELRYGSLRFVQVTHLKTRGPLSPEDLEEKILNQCEAARNALLKRWLPEIGMVFVVMRNEWRNLVPKKRDDSLRQVKKFFNCVAALMSQQLRSMAIASLQEFADYIKGFAVVDKNGPVNSRSPLSPSDPALKINLASPERNEGEQVIFSPSLDTTRSILENCLKEIVFNTTEFPRIEVEIFPEMKDKPLYLFPVDWNEDIVKRLTKDVLDAFDSNLMGPINYIRSYAPYENFLNGKEFKDKTAFLEKEPSFQEFKVKLLEYKELTDQIQKIPEKVSLRLFLLDCGFLNSDMIRRSEMLRNELINHIVELNRSWNRSICDQFDEMATKLGEIPEETKELVQLQRYLKISISETMPELMKRISTATKRVLFLLDYTLFPTEDIQLNTRVFQWPKDMAAVFELAKTRTGHKRDQIEDDLREEIDKFEADLRQMNKELEVFMKKDPPVLTMEEMKTSVGIVDRLESRCKSALEKLQHINQEELYLDWDPSEYAVLREMSRSIEMFSTLWHTALDFHEKYERWYNGPLKGLDPNIVQKMVEEMLRNATKLAKTFSDTPSARRIAETMRSKIEKFRAYLPVLHTLCNPGLRDRHWDQISAANGAEIVRKDDTSLADMIEAGLHKIIPQLEEIGSSASKEFALETAMGKMKDEWKNVQFECIPYRESGVSILSGVEEIQQMLDDHILKAQTMHSSAYIKPFEDEMTTWENKLISMQDILDAWLRCQESWLYLEPIFNSEDIMKQMPTEGRKFNKVDRIWRNIMAKTVADPRVLQATSQQNMLTNLQEANNLLDEIMKGLNDYLEKKRLFFPRFFFLSNDELLEILSETKDPLRVQPHIKKCFEGIYNLLFQPDKFGNQDIIGMRSVEEEEVSFSNTIYTSDAKGMVEKWLLQVEKQMINSLQEIINESILDFFETDLTKWVLKWPGQAVSCSSIINWTTETSEAIKKAELDTYLSTCNSFLYEIVQLIKRGLSPRAELTSRTLIVLRVYARDVVEKLIEEKVSSTDDFMWKSQLRYYNYPESGVSVEMVTTVIKYGYEYLGNTSRLVMTPLTERCYRTLMGALKLNLGGAPEGPAGSGKTETCKDLAKAVAKQCVVFNCSDGIDYHGMGKFLKGLAQSGAWACFDEFNRIDLNVLSVVAQQIHTIQNAIATNLTTFHFEGADLTLNPSCSIFITMNPSYNTRNCIPDSLKLLFRPVAMVLPDFSLIAEVMLYSMGFQNARTLARKIVDTYRLCSEQLSYQPHYDYGMRAVKAVLQATNKLKIESPEDDDESLLILRSLNDVNLPKFVTEDVPLFKGILKDIFPMEYKEDTKTESEERLRLKEFITAACLESKLQPTPKFLQKILQFYDTIVIRHGVMIVGETMSCKTTIYQILSKALNLLADKFPEENRAGYKIINPKSITMHQLYGLFDPVTREWSDGVLGKTFREMAASTVNDRKWIVFDGPVDSDWIENLNTVLDDSKKLCLMNGEIIHLTPKMNLIFEMGDLLKASPATVGRCGMIYTEGQLLGWRPIKKSFMESLPDQFTKETLNSLEDLFEWLIPPCLKVLAGYTLCIPFSKPHLFQNFLRLLNSTLKIKELCEGKASDKVVDIIDVQMKFLFAVLWGLCSTISKVDREKFDVFFRNLVDGLIKGHGKPTSFKLVRANLIPDQGSVFDFTLDPNRPGSWTRWMTFVENAGLNADEDEVLIVPTIETVKQSYFLETAITHEFPLAIVGPSGTGKSFITNSLVRRLSNEKFITNVINFSARTTVNYTQEVIMSKLDRRRKGVFGPAMGKKCVVFIDDLNLPQVDSSGSTPPLELVRQWIDHGYWYDKKDSSKLELLDVFLLTALTPPSRNEICSRLLRHMSFLVMNDFDDETLRRIFSTDISWHFKKKNFEMAVIGLSESLTEACLSVYKEILKSFLPTPVKCHYKFNLRDFARVIQGIKLVPSSHLRDPNKLIRLWCHESYRVFYDRLVDDSDRSTFFEILKHHGQKEFKVDLSKILFPHMLSGSSIVTDEHLRSLCFGDYMHPESEKKIYDEIPDISLLTKALEHYLKEYNSSGTKAPMSLVMFRFAVEHTSRINRIIKNGHALLIGIGGSGRQSLTRLAAFIANYELFQIEVNKTYGIISWRNDLKKILKRAGADGKKVVFLFNDQQIKHECFLEDISMILNTGEVPNLFTSEEKAEILDKVQSNLRSYGGSGQEGETSFANFYGLFLRNIKLNLRIVLCMSPIGSSFRNRLRMFPSLVNCCTIDWFSEWPKDALVRVATKFLESMENEEVRQSCVVMCGHFHDTVRKASIKFYEEFRRRNYVTPTSYLALILTFKSLLEGKKNEIIETKTRYELGLGKLEFASSQVAAMQNELTALRPQLLDTSDETEKLMIKIEQDTIQVEAKKEIVACDEALANEAAAAAQAIRDDCENDLAEAIPALQSAVASLNTLNPNDITVVKTMKNPAPIVKFVVEAVCIMKGVLPDRRPDTENKGRLIDDYWSPGQKMMGDIKFLDTLRAYDKDNISPSIMKRIREKYVNNPYFDPNLVKKVSTACEGLCKWVRAIEVYDRVIKIVSPKKAKLAEAETELARQMDKLNDKRAQLQAVTDKLQALNDEFAAMTKKKKDLEDNIRLCSQKLDRAEKLIKGLGGERDRWSFMAEALGKKLKNITGDVLLASGAVAYLGPFNVVFRKYIIADWQKECLSEKIPCSENFSLINILGDPVQIRQWHIAGLPKDAFSVDNGVIIKNANRWPLMIDPQGQASIWIKNMEKENNLIVIKYNEPDYLLPLGNAIQSGCPALLEGIGEDLDPGLESVLLKQTFKHKGTECISVGDQIIEYDPNFRLYIITSLRNPHFPPEVTVKVTLLNFMITPEGLQDQLLGILAAAEKPELEEMKNKLIVESASNKKELKNIEDKILRVLSASQGNILEDETAIRILSSSKVLSEEIEEKQKVASQTEKEIDQTRDGYSPVATHSSVLFFCISELSRIDPMYQFSLSWFIRIYVKAIENTPAQSAKKSDGDIQHRTQTLNKNFTEVIFQKISLSLLQEHVIVFSFILSVRLSNEDWCFLLDDIEIIEHKQRNPDPKWIKEKTWNEIVTISNKPTFQGLSQSIIMDLNDWKTFFYSAHASKETLPNRWRGIKDLEFISLLKILCPDRVIFAVQNFISKKLGPEFVDPPLLNFEALFQDSSPETPIILILSPGADPLSYIYDFKVKDPDRRPSFIKTISLGQGQGSKAESALISAAKEGGWVILQNCHLAIEWTHQRLEMLWENEVSIDVHPTFRLWLTSYSTKKFPAKILQSGIKVSLQSPGGLKTNMSLAYSSPPISYNEFYNADQAPQFRIYYRRLVFALVYFHSVVLERLHYSGVGWNVDSYEFSKSDLSISLKQLNEILLSQSGALTNDEVELLIKKRLPAIRYLTAECNYGGRVTEFFDRRLLHTLISTYLSSDVSIKEKENLSPSYAVPGDLNRQNVLEIIYRYPQESFPDGLGLHANSALLRNESDSRKLINWTNLVIKNSVLIEGIQWNLSDMDIRVKGLLDVLPHSFNLTSVYADFPVLYEDSLNTTLHLELSRYNALLQIMRETLNKLLSAIRGKTILSSETETSYREVRDNKVLSSWKAISYESLHSLNDYVNDLNKRVGFFKEWISGKTAPDRYWISGFFFPQSLLTSVLQNYARKSGLNLNQLEFNFKVLQEREKVMEAGVIIHGIHIEGAGWDADNGILVESLHKTHLAKLPPMCLFPSQKQSKESERTPGSLHCYDCPVYRTLARKGEILSTGHSTNYVFTIKLPSHKTPDHWVLRGVAGILQIPE